MSASLLQIQNLRENLCGHESMHERVNALASKMRAMIVVLVRSRPGERSH